MRIVINMAYGKDEYERYPYNKHDGANTMKQILIVEDDKDLSEGISLASFLSASEISSRNISREKDKIKELISDISHQTKTPIANILLYSQLLEEQPLPEESQKCISALSSQAEKLSFSLHW